MTARWYLILFIITILFVLFLSAFNIYEQERIKRKCKSCVENQDFLIILNVIVMFLILILLFGYFFSKESKQSSIIPTPKTQTSYSSPSQIPKISPFQCQGTIDIISKI